MLFIVVMTLKESRESLIDTLLGKQTLQESLSSEDKSDVRYIVRKEFEKKEKEIIDMIKKELSSKENKEFVAQAIKDALINFHKTLWTKKDFWINSLKD